MATTKIIRAAVLGASGYTGADMIRLAALHPAIRITALIAKGHAGQTLAQVFPHLASLPLPALVSSEEADWDAVDVVFCGLPHGTAHGEIGKLPKRVKVIDMSADFRLHDAGAYAEWYGNEHSAPALLKDAVYGLTEHYRDKIATARLVACPGCYPTAVLLALLPLVKAKLIDTSDLIIDAKSGVSGAGRSLKQNILFSEAGEGLSPYGIGNHRHLPEIEQPSTMTIVRHLDGAIHFWGAVEDDHCRLRWMRNEEDRGLGDLQRVWPAASDGDRCCVLSRPHRPLLLP